MKQITLMAAAAGLAVAFAGVAVAGPVKSPIERYVTEQTSLAMQIDTATEACTRVVLPNRMRPPFKRDADCAAEPSFVKAPENGQKAETALSR